MKEYAIENGKEVDLKKLIAPPMPREAYAKAHQYLPIACHDAVIEYQGSLLLVVRNNLPAKDILWVIGGRINRGMPIIESLKKKVKEECGLDLEEIKEMGTSRTFWNTDPFDHGQGTDTINFMFYARGKGKLRLDKLHTKPIIVTPAQYTAKFRNSLHPYVRDLMDEGMKIIQDKSAIA